MNNHDEELLAELLLQWEELYERGQDSSAQELCRDCPHLIETLSKRIVAMKATTWLNDPDCPAEMAAATSHHSVGMVLGGRYRLDDLVATGGFAEVWRAFDTELQRIVAIKLPKPSRLASAVNFITEARRVARLKHPSIVPVHDVGTQGDNCFIVSEYVEGGSLGGRLTKAPPKPTDTVRWLTEIAAALEYAHIHGVIHRDVKPANILIDHHGRALLTDFGIAQSAQKTGMFAPSLGTLRYMSPEQLEGKAATPQSDIYSLGVVLHECLTGRLPYVTQEPSDLRRDIVAGNTHLAKEVPAGLLEVCHRALKRLPHERHTSAAHFSTDLLRHSQARAPSLTRWKLAAFLFALVVASLSYVTLRFTRPGIPAAQWWNARSFEEGKDALPPTLVLPPGVERLPTVENSVGMQLVRIPPGTFVMGSTTGNPDEAPAHRVTLSASFHLGRTEVTNRQWKQVMGEVPAAWGGLDFPARWVSWEQALVFCQKLSALPEERVAGRSYRLPSEAEWEYACRATSQTAFSHGDDDSALKTYGWFIDNSGVRPLDGHSLAQGDLDHAWKVVARNHGSTHRVAKLRPNRWGLFDMHGNVSEWCADWHGAYHAGDTADPLGPSDGDGRIFRGGGWRSQRDQCRSAFRSSLDPTYRLDDLGFRVVMMPATPAPGGGQRDSFTDGDARPKSDSPASLGKTASLSASRTLSAAEIRQQPFAHVLVISHTGLSVTSLEEGARVCEGGVLDTFDPLPRDLVNLKYNLLPTNRNAGFGILFKTAGRIVVGSDWHQRNGFLEQKWAAYLAKQAVQRSRMCGGLRLWDVVANEGDTVLIPSSCVVMSSTIDTTQRVDDYLARPVSVDAPCAEVLIESARPMPSGIVGDPMFNVKAQVPEDLDGLRYAIHSADGPLPATEMALVITFKTTGRIAYLSAWRGGAGELTAFDDNSMRFVGFRRENEQLGDFDIWDIVGQPGERVVVPEWGRILAKDIEVQVTQ